MCTRRMPIDICVKIAIPATRDHLPRGDTLALNRQCPLGAGTTVLVTSRVPVEGKSSVCVICMKYRIIILIIINSLGQILLSYIANTSRTHAPPSLRLSLFAGSVAPYHDGVNAPFRRFRWRSMAGRWFIQINTRTGDPVSPEV